MACRPLYVCLVLMTTLLLLVPSSLAGGGNGYKKPYKNKYSAEANAATANANADSAGQLAEPKNVKDKYADASANKKYKRSAAATDDEDSNEIPPPPPPEKYDPDFRTLHKPFRMAKLNMVWSKAQQRLTEPKLKSLFTDLKIHDKEELAWKQLNGQHKDKDGLKEGALRQKLIGIMSTYDILEHFDDTQDPEKYKHHKAYAGRVTKDGEHKHDSHKNRSLFKDKKLSKLWERAEVSGFTAEELAALREEFVHHQDKVDMYYSILEDTVSRRKDERHENAVNEDEFDHINQIQHAEEDEPVTSHRRSETSLDAAGVDSPNAGSKRNAYVDEANLLRDKHRDLRDNFDRLERIAARAPNSEDFIEPKVQSLWRVASAGNFTVDELASLRVELLHFESRLLKLRHLHAEQALNVEKYKDAVHQSKHDKYASMDEHIKKQLRKVEKMQVLLEERIFLHSEL